MKRVYNQYWMWEDYQNGMYRDSHISAPEWFDYVQKSSHILCNEKLFEEKSLDMINSWTCSASENLTNVHSNRKAWIGQATCCFVFGCPEKATKQAWKEMSDEQRIIANAVAEKVIKIYERENKELYKGMGSQMLF